MNPSEKIETFFRDVQSGSRSLSELAIYPFADIRPAEMQNYLAEISGQPLVKEHISKAGEKAYALWLQRRKVRAFDLVTEASIDFLERNGWQDQESVTIVLTDKNSGRKKEFDLPLGITVGDIEDFAQSRGFFLVFIQEDNQIPSRTNSRSLSRLRNVEIALISSEEEESAPAPTPQKPGRIVSIPEDGERGSFPVPNKTATKWNVLLRPIVWQGDVRLLRSERVRDQNVNSFAYDDLRVLGGYLLRTRSGRDFYAFDYDDTLASVIGNLRAQGYLQPAISRHVSLAQASAEILYPGAEKLFGLANGNFVIITNRGKTDDPTKGTEGAKRFLEENGGLPAAVYGARISPEILTPKGVVFVNIIKQNPRIFDNIDTFHFVDDDPDSLESVRDKLTEYFSSRRLTKTINLYQGAGSDIFALLQALRPDEIERYSDDYLRTQDEIYISPSAPVARPQSPPRVQAAPRRNIDDLVHTPKVTIPRAYRGPECQERARSGNVRIEVCACQDLRAVRDIVLTKGRESVFVFDFDDTLFSRAADVWYRGYARPPSTPEAFYADSEKFFPHPGAREILTLATRGQPNTPRIMILTNRNEVGVAETRELMETMGFDVPIFTVSRRGESVGKGQRLAEIFSENPELLRGVTDVYFIDDNENHMPNMLNFLPPFLNTLRNPVTLHTYQMPGVDYFKLDDETISKRYQEQLGDMLD